MYSLSLLLDLLGNSTITNLCPVYSPFFGSFGIALAMCLTNLGSAYGIAKSSLGISSLGVMKPEVVMKGILPVIFAGIIPIYGIIISIMIVAHRLSIVFFPLPLCCPFTTPSFLLFSRFLCLCFVCEQQSSSATAFCPASLTLRPV